MVIRVTGPCKSDPRAFRHSTSRFCPLPRHVPGRPFPAHLRPPAPAACHLPSPARSHPLPTRGLGRPARALPCRSPPSSLAFLRSRAHRRSSTTGAGDVSRRNAVRGRHIDAMRLRRDPIRIVGLGAVRTIERSTPRRQPMTTFVLIPDGLEEIPRIGSSGGPEAGAPTIESGRLGRALYSFGSRLDFQAVFWVLAELLRVGRVSEPVWRTADLTIRETARAPPRGGV